MRASMGLLLFLCAAVLQVALALKRYDGYQVIDVTPSNQDQVDLLRSLEAGTTELKVDFWAAAKAAGKKATIAVTPDQLSEVELILTAEGIPYDVRVTNLQVEIDREREEASRRKTPAGIIDLFQYNSHEVMNTWLSSLVTDDGLISTFSVGNSFEGREMKGIKIGSPSSRRKPSIWIDAGIHAREWIAPATALYIIDRLVQDHTTDTVTQQMVDLFDWYILPSANPDGYEYSREHDRLWRKTRSLNNGSSCVGVDPNRNWDYHWNEIGASSNPCAEIYAGPVAFSEQETRNIADFLLQHKSLFVAYLTIHAYGQYWLYPWGYTSEYPDDRQDLEDMAQAAVAAIRAEHGEEYTVGSSTNVLYAAAGGSDDWAKGVAGIKYSYTLELRDQFFYGFILPADQIEPTGEEIWASLQAVATQLIHRKASPSH